MRAYAAGKVCVPLGSLTTGHVRKQLRNERLQPLAGSYLEFDVQIIQQ